MKSIFIIGAVLALNFCLGSEIQFENQWKCGNCKHVEYLDNDECTKCDHKKFPTFEVYNNNLNGTDMYCLLEHLETFNIDRLENLVKWIENSDEKNKRKQCSNPSKKKSKKNNRHKKPNSKESSAETNSKENINSLVWACDNCANENEAGSEDCERCGKSGDENAVWYEVAKYKSQEENLSSDDEHVHSDGVCRYNKLKKFKTNEKNQNFDEYKVITGFRSSQKASVESNEKNQNSDEYNASSEGSSGKGNARKFSSVEYISNSDKYSSNESGNEWKTVKNSRPQISKEEMQMKAKMEVRGRINHITEQFNEKLSDFKFCDISTKCMSKIFNRALYFEGTNKIIPYAESKLQNVYDVPSLVEFILNLLPQSKRYEYLDYILQQKDTQCENKLMDNRRLDRWFESWGVHQDFNTNKNWSESFPWKLPKVKDAIEKVENLLIEEDKMKKSKTSSTEPRHEMKYSDCFSNQPTQARNEPEQKLSGPVKYVVPHYLHQVSHQRRKKNCFIDCAPEAQLLADLKDLWEPDVLDKECQRRYRVKYNDEIFIFDKNKQIPVTVFPLNKEYENDY